MICFTFPTKPAGNTVKQRSRPNFMLYTFSNFSAHPLNAEYQPEPFIWIRGYGIGENRIKRSSLKAVWYGVQPGDRSWYESSTFIKLWIHFSYIFFLVLPPGWIYFLISCRCNVVSHAKERSYPAHSSTFWCQPNEGVRSKLIAVCFLVAVVSGANTNNTAGVVLFSIMLYS